MSKPIYVLGTGLSHDGSSCLLKDGKIIVAIEKERLTRIKHDGGNDADTVQYCLDTAGIKISDLSLVVQSANFEKDEIKKIITGESDCLRLPQKSPLSVSLIIWPMPGVPWADLLLVHAISWSLMAAEVFMRNAMISPIP